MLNSSVIWILVSVVLLICGIASAFIAQSKNRNAFGYFFLGFFGGILGFIVALAVPKLGVGGQELRKCGFCKGEIPVGATRCMHCGADFRQEGPATIEEGMMVTIARDILVEDDLAFGNGDQVQIELIDPDPLRPENRYVVKSSNLGKQFRLSKWDIRWE